MHVNNKKYLIGSRLLELNNAKDYDYIVIMENEANYRKRIATPSTGDCVYVSMDKLEEQCLFKGSFSEDNWDHRSVLTLIVNYQLDKDIIKQDFPIEYHILSHKERMLKLLKFIVDNKLLNFNSSITINKYFCPKIIYHFAYNLFIIMNNSPIITPEQKEIIQKIHDIRMPISYLNQLKRLLDMEIKKYNKEKQL